MFSAIGCVFYIILGGIFQCILIDILVDRIKIYYLLRQINVNKDKWKIAGKLEYFLRYNGNRAPDKISRELKYLIPNIDEDYCKTLSEIL